MRQTGDKERYESLMADARTPFQGWDFARIVDTLRMVTSPFSWSYASKVIALARSAESMLDMGTGGGEFLSLLQPLPKRTCATEGYAPNVPIARSRLEPLGIKVAQVTSDDALPFESDQFDLVVNRHESYSAKEVVRILKPRGRFLTEQVGGLNNLELNRLLGAARDVGMTHWTAAYAGQQLTAAGLKVVEQREEFPVTRFYDAGAIVYYLKAVPWQVPDFTVERYSDALLQLQEQAERDGFVDVKGHCFLILAVKP